MENLKKQWNQGDSGILYFLTVFLALVIASVAAVIVNALIDSVFARNIINTAVLYVSMFLILIFYAKKRDYSLIETSNLKEKLNMADIIILFLVAGVSIWFFLPLNNLFIQILRVTGFNFPVSPAIDKGYKVVLDIVFLCIIPSLTEELIYRNSILNGLRKNYSPLISILICSVMFALFHMNGAQFIYQILMGSILCLVCLIFRTLKASVILHFFNNLIVVITVFISGEEATPVNLDFKFVSSALGMALLGIIIIILLLIIALISCKITKKGFDGGNLTKKSLTDDFKAIFSKNKCGVIIKDNQSNKLFIICLFAIIVLWMINFGLGFVKI